MPLIVWLWVASEWFQIVPAATCVGRGFFNGLLNLSEAVYIACDKQNLVVKSVEGKTEERINFEKLVSIEISGTGLISTNAGVVGGGFGIEGFLQGALTAAAINALTTRTQNNTFLRITSASGEMFFHITNIEPTRLRILLSSAFSKNSKYLN